MQIVEQNEEGAYTSGSTTTLTVEQSVEGVHTSDITENFSCLVSCKQWCEK